MQKNRLKQNKDWRSLPQEERRCRYIHSRVTESQYANICGNAHKCNMSISDFVLARCYDYEPKARLSEKELQFVDGLICAQTDYRRYFSMLQAMPEAQRKELFRNNEWMKGALRTMQAQIEQIGRLLNVISSENPLPPRTTNKTRNKD